MGSPSLLDPGHKPRLRSSLAAEPHDEGVRLFDQLRIGRPIQLTGLGLEIVRRFDGDSTLRDVQAAITQISGHIVPMEIFSSLIAAMDEALLLESPRFAEHIGGPVRKPSCIGCYDADPKKMRAQLKTLFTAPGGPGLPKVDGKGRNGKLRAALLPHMDYGRGNVTYGWGFKELIEQTDATVFVIVATSHYSAHRYTLTRQSFESPLGVVETDQAYVNCIEREYGEGLFDDPAAHIPEHSIELEVVLLQYLLEKVRPFKIVPLLCGSLGDSVRGSSLPNKKRDVGRMIGALRAAEAECTEPVCYLISGDLAHIGPKFGDEAKAEGAWLEASRKKDDAILEMIAKADPASYFETIAAEGDARRICGLPPTYLTLEATRPSRGKVLHYQQFVHPEGHESVSFAAATFYD